MVGSAFVYWPCAVRERERERDGRTDGLAYSHASIPGVSDPGNPAHVLATTDYLYFFRLRVLASLPDRTELRQTLTNDGMIDSEGITSDQSNCTQLVNERRKILLNENITSEIGPSRQRLLCYGLHKPRRFRNSKDLVASNENSDQNSQIAESDVVRSSCLIRGSDFQTVSPEVVDINVVPAEAEAVVVVVGVASVALLLLLSWSLFLGQDLSMLPW